MNFTATNDKPTLWASGRSARGNQLEISGQWQISVSALAQFSLSDISRYFPEYLNELARRLS